MICRNAKQLLQTALRNAIPMHSQGYTAESTGRMPAAKPYIVTSPKVDESGEPIRYTVSLSPETCDCMFFTENHTVFQLGECTCKHVEFCKSIESENARIDAMIEAQDEIELYRAEAENFRNVTTAERLYQDACHTHR